MADENKETTAVVDEPATETKDRTVRSSTHSAQWPREKLSIDLIEVDHKYQARTRTDDNHVESLRDVIKAGREFAGDPIVVYEVEDKPKEAGKKGDKHYILTDGFHRVEAYKREGKKRVPVELRQGTRTDALRHSLGANPAHGLPRTTADKERAITLALKDEVLGKASNLTLSKVCMVSQGLVARVRDAFEKANGGSGKRVGEDGKVRTAHRAVGKSVQERKAVREAVQKLASATNEDAAAKLTRPRKGLVDEVGQDVPDNLGQVFAARVNIKGLLAMLGNVKTQVDALRGAGVLVWGSDTIETNIAAVIADLASAIPHAVCPHCGGEGCKECAFQGKKAHGFLSEGWFNNLNAAGKKAFLAEVEAAKQDAEATEEPAEAEAAAA
jgi:ParB-like chromosome segregation protein Spo0J